MRTNYATSRDMTGSSYGTEITLMNDPKREALSEKRLLDSKNEALELIVEIETIIKSGKLTEKQISRQKHKITILLGRIALVDYGKSA